MKWYYGRLFPVFITLILTGNGGYEAKPVLSSLVSLPVISPVTNLVQSCVGSVCKKAVSMTIGRVVNVTEKYDSLCQVGSSTKVTCYNIGKHGQLVFSYGRKLGLWKSATVIQGFLRENWQTMWTEFIAIISDAARLKSSKAAYRIVTIIWEFVDALERDLWKLAHGGKDETPELDFFTILNQETTLASSSSSYLGNPKNEVVEDSLDPTAETTIFRDRIDQIKSSFHSYPLSFQQSKQKEFDRMITDLESNLLYEQ